MDVKSRNVCLHLASEAIAIAELRGSKNRCCENGPVSRKPSHQEFQEQIFADYSLGTSLDNKLVASNPFARESRFGGS